MSEKKYPIYTIYKDKILGKGAFGTVYLGKRIGLEGEKKQIEKSKLNLKNDENKTESNNNNDEKKNETHNNNESKLNPNNNEEVNKNTENNNETQCKNNNNINNYNNYNNYNNNETKNENNNNTNIGIIEEEVAFKELPNEFKDDNEALDSIQNEINISSTLDNTNIVKMIDIVEQENKKYLVYEVCNGGDLRRYMDYFGRFDEELIQIIVIKMINALFELHDKKVIHHDIKPENILIQFFPEEKKTLVDNEIIKKIKLITKNKKQIQNNNNQNNHNQNNNNQNNNCIQNNYFYQNNNQLNMNQQNLYTPNGNHQINMAFINYTQQFPYNNPLNNFNNNMNNNFNPNTFTQNYQNTNNVNYNPYNNNQNNSFINPQINNMYFYNQNNFNNMNNPNNNLNNLNNFNMMNNNTNNNFSNNNYNMNNNNNLNMMNNNTNNMNIINNNHFNQNNNNTYNINNQIKVPNQENEVINVDDNYIMEQLKIAQFKLSDFGLSKFKTDIKEKNLCGSPLYMSPELFRPETSIKTIEDPQVDIWALGVLAYEMYFGKRPFEAFSIEQLSNMYRKGEYYINLEKNEEISKEFLEFLNLCFQKNPKERATVYDLKECNFYNIAFDALNKLNKEEINNYSEKLNDNKNNIVFKIDKKYFEEKQETQKGSN